MLPFRWGLLGIAFLIAFTHGASINSAAGGEHDDDIQRYKRSYKRGQTQSQYLNFGQPELDGKAEAEATENGSRSTVSGTHGMGQAQSQFSSGDCSGCGSPVYEYPTGSPDPLTLGGNVLSHSDGKPSSIIGLPGTAGGGVLAPGTSGSVSGIGRPTTSTGYGPGSSVGLAPGADVGAGQVGRPSAGGDVSGPQTSGRYTPGRVVDLGTSGQVGQPGVGGPGTLPAGNVRPGQVGPPGIPSGYGPGGGSSGFPQTGGQFGPGTNGVDIGQQGGPGAQYAPGAGVRGAGQPGVPGTQFGPGSGVVGVGQQGGPGSQYGPGTDGLGDLGAPGTQFRPGTGVGQQGGPGTQFGPASGVAGVGQQGSPGAQYGPAKSGLGQQGSPGTQFRPVTGVGQQGGPGLPFGPGTGVASIGQQAGPGAQYGTGTGGLGQQGAPGTQFRPGTGVGQQGGPGVQFGSGSGITGVGQQGGPGARYGPGTSDLGQQGAPGLQFAPGTGVGQQGGPGAQYGPGTSGLGQHGVPGLQFGSGTGLGQQGGPGAQFSPASGVGQQGVPGTQFGPGSGIQPAGIGKPSGIGQAGERQPQRPQLIAPPASLPGVAPVFGQQPGAGYGHHMPSYRPGSDQSVLTGPAQTGIGRVPQYGPGSQTVPIYGGGGHQPTGKQVPSYITGQPGGVSYIPGQPGGASYSPKQQSTDQQTSQPATHIRPGAGYAPGQQQVPQYVIEQQGIGYPQQPGYAPGYGGQIGAYQPGYGPEQIMTQPSARPIGRPASDAGQQIGGFVQTGYPTHSGGFIHPSQHSRPGGLQPDYGQPGGVQPVGGFIQPGAGTQTGGAQPGPSHVSSTGGLLQPGDTGMPSYGFVQPGPSRGFNQPSTGFGQPRAQPAAGIPSGSDYGVPGSGAQPGAGYELPRITVQPGLRPGAGYGTRGTDFQPETGTQKLPAGAQGKQGFQPGYDQRISRLKPGVATNNQQGPSYIPMPGIVQPGAHPTGAVPGTIIQPGISQTGVFSPGSGAGQYSGGGYPQTGAGIGYGSPTQVPGVDAQQSIGVEQGTGQGTIYDTTYGQQPSRSQPGSLYGQPGVGPQYGQSGYGQQTAGVQPESEVRHPGTVVPEAQAGYRQPGAIGPGVHGGYVQPGPGATQYGQGPLQIIQPGSTLVPSGVQQSGVQQGGGSSGAAGVGGGDDEFSQAETSISNGQAAASAQGIKNGGTAKTQVQGTYSSSGSFSASAMTSDNDRSASAQVTGGAEGAMSQSQGQGGAAQSQAQVQINEKTGGTKASSQSGGIIHQSQSEVQANDKGGLADAQSSGPGQTSSQAQIGFRPGQDGEIVRSTGGGQASAQSGIHSGNSQSQIQGTSKYGVSYHGAAQSASGTKEQVATYREQNRDLFNTISQFGNTDAVTDRVDTVYNPSLTSDSDIPDLQLKNSKTNKEVANSNKLDNDDSNLPEEDDEEEPYDEYEDEEDYYNENPIKMDTKTGTDKNLESQSLYRTHTQTSPTQTQQVAVADSTKKYSIVQNQNGRVQTHPTRATTETVPSGFRGTVNVEKKFHTKSLEPHKSENKLNITADEKSEHKPRTPDSFVTVTKSVTGSMDNSKNPPQDNKNFQSTYYTKSSTCGYFTFSCNIVYGANGRSKICRPKAPTNGKC